MYDGAEYENDSQRHESQEAPFAKTLSGLAQSKEMCSVGVSTIDKPPQRLNCARPAAAHAFLFRRGGLSEHNLLRKSHYSLRRSFTLSLFGRFVWLLDIASLLGTWSDRLDDQ